MDGPFGPSRAEQDRTWAMLPLPGSRPWAPGHLRPLSNPPGTSEDGREQRIVLWLLSCWGGPDHSKRLSNKAGKPGAWGLPNSRRP